MTNALLAGPVAFSIVAQNDSDVSSLHRDHELPGIDIGVETHIELRLQGKPLMRDGSD
jgi:hypothetical protein